MRTWRFHEFGALENMVLEDIPVPEPGPGEVLLRVHFAALNPADQFLVRRLYPGAGEPPLSVGRDGSGVAVKLGPGAGARIAEGAAVVVLRSEIGTTRPGTLAEFVTVPEESLAPLPEGWSFEEGAAGPLVHLTAWRALVDCGILEDASEQKTKTNVLITGASGGVGSAAVSLAHALGARVVALSRSEEKRKILKEMGADIVLDSESEALEKEVREALGGKGVDLVIENLGGDYLSKCVRMAGRNGRIQVIGLLSQFTSEINLGLVIHKCLHIQGIHVGQYSPQEARAAWARVVAHLDRIGHRPRVDQVFETEAVLEAFARLAAGPMGKVLVRFGG